MYSWHYLWDSFSALQESCFLHLCSGERITIRRSIEFNDAKFWSFCIDTLMDIGKCLSACSSNNRRFRKWWTRSYGLGGGGGGSIQNGSWADPPFSKWRTDLQSICMQVGARPPFTKSSMGVALVCANHSPNVQEYPNLDVPRKLCVDICDRRQIPSTAHNCLPCIW